MRYLLSIILLVLLTTCNFESPLQISECKKLWSQYQWNRADSLQIAYMVRAWDEQGYYGHRSYFKRFIKIDSKTIDFFFPAVFYNPEKTRLVAWIACRYKNNLDTIRLWTKYDSTQKYTYDMTGLIGYRYSSDSLWNIYPFYERSPDELSSIEDGKELLCDYYFREMKNDYILIPRDKINEPYGGEISTNVFDDSPYYFKQIGYNLQEPDFWTKALLWQKGTVFDSLYHFQLSGLTPQPIDRRDYTFPPQITYPDSILKLFPRAYAAAKGRR